MPPQKSLWNKCVGDDTKAAARQSLNCIKNKNKKCQKRFSIWQIKFLHPAMWHDHDIDFARWLHPAMWHGGLSRLHSADEDAVSWLTNYGKWHAYEKKKNVAWSSGIVTVNSSPSGSTLYCTCSASVSSDLKALYKSVIIIIIIIVALSHATEFAQMSAILQFYIWFGFRPHLRSGHVCTNVRILSKLDHPRQKSMS